MNERTIIFRLGEENGIVIQKNSFDTSLFLNQYQQAINIFNHLWKEQEEWAKSSSTSPYLDNQFSNVIAFCGDRGEGKTSCMSSFATILTDEQARKNACTTDDNQLPPITIPTDFLRPQEIEWLDTIDPSFFDTKHNLLELLLGRMYANVSRRSQNRISNDDRDKSYHRRLLMEQFEKVKTDISKIEKNDAIYDSLEEISDLAAGVNLKSDLQELFNRYLKYVGKKCLLICIDDLDLNISEGYKMAEMLRKYLVCPQCIILVAVKVEQLIDVIATAHKKEVGNADITWEQCLNMAQKYVAKLLPRRNRISMPIPTDFCEYELEIMDSEDSNNKDKEENKDKEQKTKFTVKEKVVQMIFQKTGYVFYNTQHLSPIIPKNLRSLRHLLGMLYSVPDAKDTNGNDNEIGRDTFKNYFFGTWAAQLPDKDYTFAQQLAQYDDLTTLNAFVVEYFAKRVENDTNIKILETDLNEEYAKLYLSITSKKNTATNISYGDVMYILWFINSISLDMTVQNLIFLIKTVYSMRLYSCYKQISRGKDYLYPPTPKVEEVVHIHRAETLYANVNQLQRLINGSYFTYPQGELLPIKEKNKFRDKVIVHIRNIRRLIDDVKNKADDFESNLRLCEYLALCISRTTINKEQFTDIGLNRTEKIPTYLGQLSPNAQYVVFDFLQPFCSLCNIEYAYERFDSIFGVMGDNKKNLYNVAKEMDSSLLNKLLKAYGKEDSWEQMYSLVADAAIRVVDAQWAIYDELLRTRNLHKNGDEAIFSAYDDIQKLKIKLYPVIRKEQKSSKKSKIFEFKFLSIFNDSINRNNLGEILYTTKEEKQIEEMLQLFENIKVKLAIFDKPITGKEARDIISNASQLRDRQKAAFTIKLRNLIKDTDSYEGYDDIMAKGDDLGKLYIEAKTPKKNVKKNTKKPIKK